MLLRKFATVSLVLVALPLIASAQVQTGAPPFGSFGGGPDVINLANLNSHITVPVLHKPGRGTDFTYDLSYDTSVWTPTGASGSQTWSPVLNFGWRGITEVATGFLSFDAHNIRLCGRAPTSLARRSNAAILRITIRSVPPIRSRGSKS